MFKLQIGVNKNNYNPEFVRGTDSSLKAAHLLYEGIKQIVPDRKTYLSKDINRMTHVYVQAGGDCQDISDEIHDKAKAGNSGQEIILENLVAKNQEKRQKLEGLCQDVGNSVMDLVIQNFRLNLSKSKGVELPIKIESLSVQNLVKVNENEYRWDQEELQYLFLSQSGKVFYLDSQHEIQECPFEALAELKNAKVGPDGKVALNFKVDNVAQQITCFPLMKSNATANVKFDENNKAEVDIKYSFETFDPRMEYTGSQKSPEIIAFEKKPNHSDAQVLRQSEFPGLNTKEETKAMELLVQMTLNYKLDTRGKFINNLLDFQSQENKDPMTQMSLYSEFFKRAKSTFKHNKPSFFGFGKYFQRLNYGASYKAHIYYEILNCEKKIALASAAQRPILLANLNTYLQKSENELKLLKDKNYKKMVLDRFYGKDEPKSGGSLQRKNEINTATSRSSAAVNGNYFGDYNPAEKKRNSTKRKNKEDGFVSNKTSVRPGSRVLDIPGVEDEAGLAQAIAESLQAEAARVAIGPRKMIGWVLQDVEDKGNCFYDSVVDQLTTINHSFIAEVPTGTLARDALRLKVQGEAFKDQEWADEPEIIEVVKKLDVVLGIVDTRYPELGLRYYFQDNNGDVITSNDKGMLPNKDVLEIAFTGNHYLSVKSKPERPKLKQ